LGKEEKEKENVFLQQKIPDTLQRISGKSYD
jgi:hypothetical protein